MTFILVILGMLLLIAMLAVLLLVIVLLLALLAAPTIIVIVSLPIGRPIATTASAATPIPLLPMTARIIPVAILVLVSIPVPVPTRGRLVVMVVPAAAALFVPAVVVLTFAMRSLLLLVTITTSFLPLLLFHISLGFLQQPILLALPPSCVVLVAFRHGWPAGKSGKVLKKLRSEEVTFPKLRNIYWKTSSFFFLLLQIQRENYRYM